MSVKVGRSLCQRKPRILAYYARHAEFAYIPLGNNGNRASVYCIGGVFMAVRFKSRNTYKYITRSYLHRIKGYTRYIKLFGTYYLFYLNIGEQFAEFHISHPLC